MTTHSEPEAGTRNVWQFDPNHTLVEFVAKHMMITTVRGRFKGVQGTLILDETDPSRSSVEVDLDAASLYSGVDYRDNHLKSGDFLEVEKYAKTSINRKDYGLNWNMALESGGWLVGDTIKIEIAAEGVR